jgi:integrase
MKGSTYRRCYCRGEDGKPLGKACPQLSSRRHGTWAVRQELPATAEGKRRSFSRSGYDTSKTAQAALDHLRALLALPEHDDAEGQLAVGDLLDELSRDSRAELPKVEDIRRRLNLGLALNSKLTVGEWLAIWLDGKKSRRKTVRGYESIIRVHLVPLIGHIRLARLSVPHLDDMFAALDDRNDVIAAENAQRREQEWRATWGKRARPPGAERERLAAERAKLADMPPYRKLTGPATKQRIRACLRTALNAAIARQGETGLTFNAAVYVELAGGARPKPVLWTEENIVRWQETGQKPSPVMVWTPEQIGAFLDAAEEHRLYAFFHLIAFRGLRRGEGVGLEWAGVDLEKKLLAPSREIVMDGWTPIETELKTEGSAAVIALDDVNAQVLAEHRTRMGAEQAERLKDRLPWTDSGKVFVDTDGGWLHPEKVSAEFERIAGAAGLPPINLRDLRHVAATLIHAGGGDLFAIKETLRHGSIKLAGDTYTNLLPQVDREIANKAVAVVPRARKSPENGQAPA